MNTTTKQLHDLRGQQLKALHDLASDLRDLEVKVPDLESIHRYSELCGAHYDTRNLSDKALEEIDTLASRYLERVS